MADPTEPERDLREHALVDAIADDCAAARRVIAAQEAQVMRCLADAWALAQEQTARIPSADSRKRDMPLRDISARVAVELHLNDRSVQSRMYDAWRLVTRFPATVVALEQGRISKQHADALADVGAALETDDVRRAFEEVVLEWAESETVGRTRAYARQLAEKLNPRTMAERHEDAADERSITIVDLDNGMSQIIALVPTIYAHAVHDRLTQQAAHVKKAAARKRAARRASGWRDENEADAGAHGNRAGTESDGDGDGGTPARSDEDACDSDDGASRDGGVGDERTTDHIRADLFTDMLLTAQPTVDPTDGRLPGGLGAIRAEVQITVPLTTLTGVTAGGAEVDGKAPIDPETARLLAGATTMWDRVMYEPITGVVVAVDRYRQTRAQERFLRARDRRCRFPGCRQPARLCQCDHNHEHHEGGSTEIGNLGCLCVRHHTLKTETEWTARQLPGGRIEWSSPAGRRYIDEPPRVVFRPEPDLSPAPF